MRSLHITLAAGTFFLLSPAAFALVDGQLEIGKRSAKFSTDDYSESMGGTEVELAVHVDPIPLIPVAAGLYLINQKYDPDKDGDVLANDSFSGSQIGIEVMAWLPIPLYDLEPYAKLGYSFFGAYTGSASSRTAIIDNAEVTGKSETEYSLTGVHYGVGIRWNVIPLVGLLFEVDLASETLELTKYSVGGEDLDLDDIDAEDVAVSSNAILIGAEVGF